MDKKNMKVAVYFRTATVPIEQKVWLYASSKSSEQAEWRDLSVEAMKHTDQQNGLVVAGVSTDSSRQLPPMERPGVQEMLSAVREGKAGAVMMPSLHHLGRDFDAILPVLADRVSSSRF